MRKDSRCAHAIFDVAHESGCCCNVSDSAISELDLNDTAGREKAENQFLRLAEQEDNEDVGPEVAEPASPDPTDAERHAEFAEMREAYWAKVNKDLHHEKVHAELCERLFVLKNSELMSTPSHRPFGPSHRPFGDFQLYSGSSHETESIREYSPMFSAQSAGTGSAECIQETNSCGCGKGLLGATNLAPSRG